MSEKENTLDSEFKDELELLDKEMASIDSLYNMVIKEIKDIRSNEDSRNARISRTSSPNTYLYNMFANANSIKTNKLSLIAHRVQIKKIIEELKLKNKNKEDEGGIIKSVLADLVKEISDKKSEEVIHGKVDNNEEIEDENLLEAEAEKAFNEAMDENPKLDITNEEETNEDKEMIDESKLAISTDGKLYLLNDNDEVESELELDEKEFYLERDKHGKVNFAKTISTNKEIQIIELED